MCRTLNDRAGWCATVIACIGLAVVAFSGCAHQPKQPPCVSYCGMLIEDRGNGSMSCEYIDKAEGIMLDEIDKEFCSKDKRMCKKNACDAIFGWQLRLGSDVITVVKNQNESFAAVGASSCNRKEMWLGANQNWRAGSYPHELFHVIQECNPKWPATPEDLEHGPGHDGWTNNGVFDFVKDFREGRR